MDTVTQEKQPTENNLKKLFISHQVKMSKTLTQVMSNFILGVKFDIIETKHCHLGSDENYWSRYKLLSYNKLKKKKIKYPLNS